MNFTKNHKDTLKETLCNLHSLNLCAVHHMLLMVSLGLITRTAASLHFLPLSDFPSDPLLLADLGHSDQ